MYVVGPLPRLRPIEADAYSRANLDIVMQHLSSAQHGCAATQNHRFCFSALLHVREIQNADLLSNWAERQRCCQVLEDSCLARVKLP